MSVLKFTSTIADSLRILRTCAAPAVIASALGACSPQSYMPELATRAYPREQHTSNVADMQVFRRGTDIEIVNSTATSYSDFDLWVNQRYVLPMKSLPAGATRRVSLWDFFDEYGERFYAGGLFRAYPATPVRMVEIQAAEGQPMIGLVTIRTEDIKAVTRQ